MASARPAAQRNRRSPSVLLSGALSARPLRVGYPAECIGHPCARIPPSREAKIFFEATEIAREKFHSRNSQKTVDGKMTCGAGKRRPRRHRSESSVGELFSGRAAPVASGALPSQPLGS